MSSMQLQLLVGMQQIREGTMGRSIELEDEKSREEKHYTAMLPHLPRQTKTSSAL